MKKNMLWISIVWVCMILLGGLIVMASWNLVVVKLFEIKEISYLASVAISFVIGLLKRGRHPRTCSAARNSSN